MKRTISLMMVLFSIISIFSSVNCKALYEDVPLNAKYMKSNDCYKAGQYIKVRGIMVHATAVPGIMAGAWYDLWNKPNFNACVHAFLDDQVVYQYLPWNQRGWHAGGKANNTHIGIEMCEPAGALYNEAHTEILSYDVQANQEYFDKAWNVFVVLCGNLCKEYGFSETNIISHVEGNSLGIATPHKDPDHWWRFHNKNMNDFRRDVKNYLNTH